jgi:hypothetical protein
MVTNELKVPFSIANCNKLPEGNLDVVSLFLDQTYFPKIALFDDQMGWNHRRVSSSVWGFAS